MGHERLGRSSSMLVTLALAACSGAAGGASLAPSEGNFVLEVPDGEPSEGNGVLVADVGDFESVQLVVEPLADARGYRSLGFGLSLSVEEWNALLVRGETLAGTAYVQYRTTHDGAIVVRRVSRVRAGWSMLGQLTLEGELAEAEGPGGDLPTPDLTMFEASTTFRARWDVSITCRHVDGMIPRADESLETPECRDLLRRAGFAPCLDDRGCQ